jgi:adenylate cyclase
MRNFLICLLIVVILSFSLGKLLHDESSCSLSSQQPVCSLYGTWNFVSNTLPVPEKTQVTLPLSNVAIQPNATGFTLSKEIHLQMPFKGDIGVLLPRVWHRMRVYLDSNEMVLVDEKPAMTGFSAFGSLYKLSGVNLSEKVILEISSVPKEIIGQERVHISQSPFLFGRYQEVHHKHDVYFYTAVILSSLLFLNAIYLFLHFIFFTEKKSYLFSGLLTFLFGLHTLYIVGLSSSLYSVYLELTLKLVPFLLYPSLLLRFLSSYFKLERGSLLYIADAVAGLSALFLLPVILQGTFYSPWLYFYESSFLILQLVFLGLAMFLCLVTLWDLSKSKEKTARLLLFSFSLSFGFLAHFIIEGQTGGLVDDMRLVSFVFNFFVLTIIVATIKLNEFEAQTLNQLFLAADRFVPRKILKKLGHDNIVDVQINDHIAQDLGIMFVDIRSYSAMSEKMSPADNFRFVNAFFGGMLPIIEKHNGTIDKLIGDAIMALFDSAEQAIEAARDLRHELDRYNSARSKRNFEEIDIGIGIHYGPVILGTVGTKNYMNATVISDAVNIAARLETLCKKSGARVILSSDMLVAISEKNRPQMGQESPVRYLGKAFVKGRSKPVGIYEYFGHESNEVISEKIRSREHYALALVLAEEGEFDLALHQLEILEVRDSKDSIVQFIKENIIHFQTEEKKSQELNVNKPQAFKKSG